MKITIEHDEVTVTVEDKMVEDIFDTLELCTNAIRGAGFCNQIIEEAVLALAEEYKGE